jgi:hypothetical protein
MPTTFSKTSFAEGRFRRAYKGTYTGPPSKRGKQCVVKESKENYTWKSTDWDMVVTLYDESKKLAGKFNAFHRSSRSIKFTDVEVEMVISRNDSGTPKLNEYVLVEDYIPGDFKKYCNNYGYISSDSELMPAFMHWSWVHTSGQMMIADLQGVLTSTNYRLTDPVLLSNTIDGGRYGCTDTGVEGMAMFFLKHTCNQFCRGLPKPTAAHVLPTPGALAQMQTIMTSTAYAHELKIPRYIRQTMITVLPQVATRQLL